MDDKEQKQRERAYKIWEEEGRVDGAHEDHWRRAEESEQEPEQESVSEVKVKTPRRSKK